MLRALDADAQVVAVNGDGHPVLDRGHRVVHQSRDDEALPAIQFHFGLHAAHDIGNKIMSPCFMYLEIRGGKFVRKDPASGFTCNKGGIVNT